MGGQMAKPSNKSMVDRLVDKHDYISSATVEGVFRAVDRAMYFELEEGEATDPYDDDPWRRGNLHLSAPCIYAKVVEALDLRQGHSFLNLGSGTGYLNTIIGLLVGPNGINHGVEFHSDVVDYAYKRLQQFKRQSYAIDKYEFSEPIFIQGNCINLNPNLKYDRIYLGAACLPELEIFMKKLVKPNGGILVMPYENRLMRYIRTSENNWETDKLMDVNFTLMIRQIDDDVPPKTINMPLARVKSLKELCRTAIRLGLRKRTDAMNPDLLNSDNIESRRARRLESERAKAVKAFKEEQQVEKGEIDLIEKSFGISRNNCQKRKHLVCNCRRDRVRSDRLPSEQAISSSSSAPPIEPSPSVSGVTTRSTSRRLDKRNLLPVPQSSSTTTSSSSSPVAGAAAATTTTATTITTTESVATPATSTKGQKFPLPRKSEATNSTNDNAEPSSSKNKTHTGNNLEPGNRSNSDRSIDDTLASSDSDDDYGPNSNGRNNDHDISLNCARTRPFVYSVRNRSSSHLPHCVHYTCDRFMGPPALLQRRIARIIDQSTSPSSSSSASSSISDSSDSRIVDEYDNIQIGRQVVLNWPGFLRIQNHQFRSASIHYLSSSPSSSESDLTDIFLEHEFEDRAHSPTALQELRQQQQHRHEEHPHEQSAQQVNQVSRSDCKRKRQSSSESSESSNPTSPTRRFQHSHCPNINNRPCGCSKTSASAKHQLVETINTTIKDGPTTSANTSSSFEQSSSGGKSSTSIASIPTSSSRASPSSSCSSHHHLPPNHYRNQKTSGRSIATMSSNLKQPTHAADRECSRSANRSRYSSGHSSSLISHSHNHRAIPTPSANDIAAPDHTVRWGSRRNPICGSFWEPLPCGRSEDGRYLFRNAPQGYYSRDSEIASQQASEAMARVKAKSQKEKEARRAAARKKREMKRKRGANECERYHNHISGYIRQLPLPRVLHSYLNYDRN